MTPTILCKVRVTLKVSLAKDYLGQDVVPYAVITFMNNYITVLGCLFRKLWKPGRLFQLVDYPFNRRCETDVREKTLINFGQKIPTFTPED